MYSNANIYSPMFTIGELVDFLSLAVKYVATHCPEISKLVYWFRSGQRQIARQLVTHTYFPVGLICLWNFYLQII